ncbi:MAG: hypothetical protein U0003_01315 [Vampirovibrionales bacterium]
MLTQIAPLQTYFSGSDGKEHLKKAGHQAAQKLDKAENWYQRQLYAPDDGPIGTPNWRRIAGYASKTNLQAGWNEVKRFWQGKDTGGKVLALATLGLAWFLDSLLVLSLIGKPFALLPFFSWGWAQSGLGRAFHYGVQKNHEYERAELK